MCRGPKKRKGKERKGDNEWKKDERKGEEEGEGRGREVKIPAEAKETKRGMEGK